MKAFTKISAKDRHRKENFQGYLFITPLFLFFVIFTAFQSERGGYGISGVPDSSRSAKGRGRSGYTACGNRSLYV